MGAALFSCQQDELSRGDISKLTDLAPGIEFSPGEGATVAKAKMKVEAFFYDAAASPLAKAEIYLLDADSAVVFSQTKDLTGTLDSMILEGNEINVTSLTAGDYTFKVVAIDTKDQINTKTISFILADQEFPSNNSEMYLAGGFNGWGADALTLVDDYTWEIQNVTLDGGSWKLKNTTDWSDQDWGDADCDGVAENATGGGPNTDCGFSGLVTIRFNDATLQYEVIQAVVLEANVTDLYLLGSFNGFEGSDYRFNQTDNNLWELDEIRLKGGDSFKFSESPYFMGNNYGDNEPDSIADAFGSNIVLPNSVEDAYYSVTFNDETLEYSITFVRYPYPDNLYLVGGGTVAGWDPGSSIPFIKKGLGQFEIYSYLTAGDGFKFLEIQDWAGDWGADGSTGNLLQEGESNVDVAGDGFYRINVDFVSGTYTVTASNWGVIGDATPGGWGADTDMALTSTTKGNYTWTIDITLGNGFIKFRENDGWDVNYGDSGADGSLDAGGSDIAVSAGTYTVTMTLDPVNGYTYTIN